MTTSCTTTGFAKALPSASIPSHVTTGGSVSNPNTGAGHKLAGSHPFQQGDSLFAFFKYVPTVPNTMYKVYLGEEKFVKIKVPESVQAGNSTLKGVFQQFNGRTIYTGMNRAKRSNGGGDALWKNHRCEALTTSRLNRQG